MAVKDIIIGVLVAYVVIDLMLAHMRQPPFPCTLQNVFDNIRDQDVLIITVVGVLIGFAVWYLSTKSRTEPFVTKEEDKIYSTKPFWDNNPGLLDSLNE